MLEGIYYLRSENHQKNQKITEIPEKATKGLLDPPFTKAVRNMLTREHLVIGKLCDGGLL